MPINRLLIDCGYLSSVVNSVCIKVGTPAMPSKGVGITAGRLPMNSRRRRPGEKYGWNCCTVNPNRKSAEFRHVAFDANFWKSFVHARLAAVAGDHGAMTLFGKDPAQHRLFAEHVAESESYVITEGHGRTVQEWKAKPSKPDNHWFDCLVGCAVAASMEGVALFGMETRKKRREEPIVLSQLQRRKW